MTIETIVFEGVICPDHHASILLAVLNSIPAEHVPSTKIEYGVEEDGCTPNLRVSYIDHNR